MIYKTKIRKIGGTSYKEVVKKARAIFHSVEKRSKRTDYLRSVYFDKEKIFINLFWVHLNQKAPRERIKRLKFLECSFDLIENSRYKPSSKINPNNKKELLHRFSGKTIEGEVFYVQIKENIKTGRKDFMSVFTTK